MKEIILRRATDGDMVEIEQMQLAVFEGEQEIPAHIIPLEEESAPRWWCASLGEEIVGAVATWEEGGQLHWGRFAIKPEHRGLGIGSRLAKFCLDDLFAGAVEEIYIEARDVTVKMMCALGGKVVGEPMDFYKGTVTPVVLTRGDYLEAQKHKEQ